MSEHDEQCAVVEYCRAKSIPVYAVPNAAKRSRHLASRMRAEGLSAGVPDLCIPVARGIYHSLYIEMKHGANKPTEEQARWIWRLREEGMCAWVCYGADSAMKLIDSYLDLRESDSL